QLLIQAEHRWPSDEARIRSAIPGRRAHLIPDVSASSRVAFTTTDNVEERELAEAQGAQSVILVPLQRGDRDLGVMVLACTADSGRRYQESDLELADQLGARFEQLIESSHLAREAERGRVQLSVLASITEILAVDLDSQARLDAIVNVVLPNVADVCAIYRP